MAIFESAPTGPKMIVPALLGAAAGGAGYGVLSTWMDVIQLKGFILLLIAILVFGLFTLTGRNFVLNLVIGLIGGVVAVSALWFGWYWVEFGQDAAVEFITSGPWGIYKNLTILSRNYVYTMDNSTSDMGATMTQMIWAGETALFFAAPVVGALVARRRALRGPVGS
jgi:hypothetical protein